MNIATKLIPVEGKDIDRLRDQKMLIVEVATQSTNGCSVGGSADLPNESGEHYLVAPKVAPDGNIVPTVGRFQIYADNLHVVLSQVRTAEHAEALRQAKISAEALRQTWLNAELSRSAQERMRNEMALDGKGSRLDEYMRRNCPHNEWTVLSTSSAFSGGLPPLLYCKVVDREGVAHDLGELDKDPSRFLIDAPPTIKNATRLASEHQASVIAEALKTVMGGAPNADVAALRAENAELRAKLDRIEQMLEKRSGNRDNRNG